MSWLFGSLMRLQRVSRAGLHRLAEVEQQEGRTLRGCANTAAPHGMHTFILGMPAAVATAWRNVSLCFAPKDRGFRLVSSTKNGCAEHCHVIGTGHGAAHDRF